MNGCRTIGISTCRAILSVFLLALITSGIPLAKVHAHGNASISHSHTHHHDNVGGHDLDELATDKSSSLADTLHVHDVNAPALSLIPQIDVDAFAAWADTPIPILPLFRPPDNVITPLYRPPIA
jgi:hypothetical protein